MGWSLWAWLKAQMDAALYRPRAAPGIVARKLVERDVVHYILKNPAEGSYLKLAEPDYFIWRQMDGSRTVKDLVVAFFTKYQAFAFGRIASLVQELKDGHFLTDKPVGVYRQAGEQLTQRDWTYRWRQFAEAFIERIFFLDGVDEFFGALYRLTRWLFAWPAQIILALVALAGFIVFVALLVSQRYAILVTGGSYWLGLLTLFLANSIILFVHEFAHALTTKHYGRQVRRGGFMIYYGMPAFFVDTMDIWLEPKARRIAVSWAGPYSGLMVGGLCSLLAILSTDALVGQLLFKTAFVGYFLFFVNLNPLLELDGYFMLIDWLEMPMLRQRSFEFIRRELWEKVKAVIGDKDTRGQGNKEKAAFSREEIIFAVFGLAAAAYTVYSLGVAIYFWQTRLTLMLADLWNRQGWFARLAVVLVGAGILVPLAIVLFATAWNAARHAIEWLEERRFFDRYRNVFLALAAGMALLALTPILLDEPWRTMYLALAPAMLLGAACAALIATAFQHQGAEFQRVFWALLAAASVLLTAQLVRSLAFVAGARGGALAAATSTLEALAALALALAGYGSLQGIDLRESAAWERAAMATLIALGFLVVVPLARWSASLPAIAAPYLVVLFTAAILPTLVAYAQTRFFPPWVALTGAALVMGARSVLRAWPGWPLGSGYDLWLDTLVAGAWALGAMAYVAASWRLRFPPSHWSDDVALSDEERLRTAFARFFQALFAGFSVTFGARRAHSVDDEMDVLAVAADWGVGIESGQVRDKLDLSQVTILEQADRYREVLSRAIDLMDNWSGSHFIARAAQAAYDSLPWPEREVLGQYVLAGTPWGGAIAKGFAAVRGERDRLIRSVPILAGCNNRAFALILAAIQSQIVRAHATLAKQGAPVDRFVIVQSGSIEKWMQDSPNAPPRLAGTLRRGASLGAEAFLGSGQYSGTYRAAVDTEILFVTRKEALSLARAGVKLAARVGEALSMAQLLGQMPMFANLAPQQLAALAQHLGRQSVTAGQAIVQQGEPRHHFFIVAQGEVEVIARGADGTERAIKRLGAGEHFGETSLFADVPYSATVRAILPTMLLTLDEPTFDKMVAGSAQMSHYIEQVSSGRLIETRRKLGTRLGIRRKL
jgi:putative peptide zinc metalloprotease protein